MKLQQQHAKDYILAGRAVVTFLNTETGKQFTYRINHYKKTNVWYVSTGWKQTLGKIMADNFQETTDPIIIANNTKAIEVFSWVWRRLLALSVPDKIHILREDVCGCCRRPLTEAASIICGIGPECRKKLGIVLPPNFLLKNQPE